jgi:hypothetical protein
MIVYCTGTKTGDEAYQILHKNIIEFIESLGHSVLSELSGKFSSTIPLTETQIYKRNLKWIDGSKLVIAEISDSELETGIEIAYALFHRKIPVLALHISDERKLTPMLLGCDLSLLKIDKYSDANEMEKIVKNFLINHSKS